jgi:putative transposase
MPQYIRAFVPGGTFFFTVTLLERRRKLLTENIDNLRESTVRLRGSRIGRIQAFIDLWNAAFITLNGRQMITLEV